MDNVKDKEAAWVLVEAGKSLDEITKHVMQNAKSQHEMALSLQRLFSGLHEKMDRVVDKMDKMGEKVELLEKRIKTMENYYLEKDVREKNRRLRQGDAFSFKPSKSVI